MAKPVFEHYLREIEHQRRVWENKPVLRKLYHHWYASVVASLAPLSPVIEIGAGSGNFKQYHPEVVATDIFKSGPWIDREVDAQDLPLATGEAGNLVAFDVLHHLQRPLDFLRGASFSLKAGGRLVLCEPALTPWSEFVYRRFHHEPLDWSWDLFGLDGTPPEPDPGHTFANEAIPEILFWRERRRTLGLLPDLKLVSARKFAFLLYPLTGGFGYRSFVPAPGFEYLLKLENWIMRPFANWLTGMRMLVVLEKRG